MWCTQTEVGSMHTLICGTGHATCSLMYLHSESLWAHFLKQPVQVIHTVGSPTLLVQMNVLPTLLHLASAWVWPSASPTWFLPNLSGTHHISLVSTGPAHLPPDFPCVFSWEDAFKEIPPLNVRSPVQAPRRIQRFFPLWGYALTREMATQPGVSVANGIES